MSVDEICKKYPTIKVNRLALHQDGKLYIKITEIYSHVYDSEISVDALKDLLATYLV